MDIGSFDGAQLTHSCLETCYQNIFGRENVTIWLLVVVMVLN